MAANSFQAALANTYAAGHGSLKFNINPAIGVAGMVALPIVGNTVVGIDDNNLYLSTNQGSASVAANGYTVLPNGIMMNWAVMAANSTGQEWTFNRAFSVNAYSVVGSANNNAAVWVSTVNNTIATVFANSVGAPQTVRLIAIGQ